MSIPVSLHIWMIIIIGMKIIIIIIMIIIILINECLNRNNLSV